MKFCEMPFLVVELSDEVKRYFMYEEYGRDASINDDGMFTEKGYIYNNRNTFTEWYDGRDAPQIFLVTLAVKEFRNTLFQTVGNLF